MQSKGVFRFFPSFAFLVTGSATLSASVCAASLGANHRNVVQGVYQDSASAVRLQPTTPSLPSREVAPDLAGRIWALEPSVQPVLGRSSREGSLATLVMPGPRPDTGSDRIGESGTSQRNTNTYVS